MTIRPMTPFRGRRVFCAPLGSLVPLALGFVVGLAPLDATASEDDPIAALRAIRTSLDVRGGDLEEVLDTLRDRHQLNLVVDWEALAGAAELVRDTRVDIRLADVPLTTALELVLVAAGGAQDVGWAIRDGVIQIGRAGDRGTRELRAYEIADLVTNGFALRRSILTPVIALETTGLELVGGRERVGSESRGSGSGSLFGGAASSGEDMSRVQDLIDLMQHLVDSESWAEYGGSIGSVRVAAGRLFIQQSARNHAEIADLFALLRDVHPAPVALDVAIVAMRVDRAAAWRAGDAKAFPLLSRRDVARFFEVQDITGLVTRATTIGRLGDAIRVGGLRQTDHVRSLTPVASGSGDAMLLRPELDTITSGLEVIVRPIIVPGTSIVRTDVDLAWEAAPVDEDRTVPGTAASVSAILEAVTRSLQQVTASADLRPGEGLALSLPVPPTGIVHRDALEYFVIVRVRPEPGPPIDRPDPRPEEGAAAEG